MKTIKKSWLTFLFYAAVFAASPALSQAQGIPVAPANNANAVLILAPQGVDPAQDNLKFNDMVRGITQGFAAGLAPLLEQRNLKVVNVLDQNPRYDAQQKLAAYSVRNTSKSAVILTLDKENVSGDDRLLLVAQHIIQELIFRDGKLVGVRPSSVVKKSYLLFGSKTGANPNPLPSLAKDFFDFLASEKRFTEEDGHSDALPPDATPTPTPL